MARDRTGITRLRRDAGNRTPSACSQGRRADHYATSRLVRPTRPAGTPAGTGLAVGQGRRRSSRSRFLRCAPGCTCHGPGPGNEDTARGSNPPPGLAPGASPSMLAARPPGCQALGASGVAVAPGPALGFAPGMKPGCRCKRCRARTATWRRRDSNPRRPGCGPGALPLSYIPVDGGWSGRLALPRRTTGRLMTGI